MSVPRVEGEAHRRNWRSALRFALGQAQMAAAVLGAWSLAANGLSRLTLVLAALASALTATSVFLFHVLPRWRAS